MNVTTLNYVQLDYLETMTDGDADMMQTMLDMLIEEIPDEIRKMNESLAQKDWEELFQISHKMKTTLSFIGNETMININKTLEHCSRHEESLAELPALVHQLDELSVKVVEELQMIR